MGLDVFVNNVGVNWGVLFKDYLELGYDKVMDLNVKFIFFLMQDFLLLLLVKVSLEQLVNVINIGLIDGMRVFILDNFVYGVSKVVVYYFIKIFVVKM